MSDKATQAPTASGTALKALVPQQEPAPVAAATGESLKQASRPGFVNQAYEYVQGLGEVIEQGFSLGLKDEAQGLGGAVGDWIGAKITGQDPGDFWESYRLNREKSIKPVKEFRESNPGSAITGEIVGGVFSAAPAAALKGVSTLRNIAIGSGFGAVAGAATSEGDLVDRGAAAAGGAVLGGGAAWALGLLTRGIANLANGSMTKTQRTAYNSIVRAFERDGIGFDDAVKQLDAWQKAGAKPEVLADLGGDNVRSLLRGALSVPTTARGVADDVFGGRSVAQHGRIIGDSLEALGVNRRMGDVVAQVRAVRAKGAELLYDTARNMPLRVRGAEYTQDDLLRLLNRPTMQKAVKQAMRQAEDMGIALPNILDDQGRVVELPDVEMLDWIKREGLDASLEKFRDVTSGRINAGDPEVRVLTTLKGEFLSVLDDLSPAYKSARAAFSGDTEMLNAIQYGRDFITKFRRDSYGEAQIIGNMSMAEKDFFRIGVAQSVQDTIEKAADTADAVKRIFGNERIREALRQAMPNDLALQRFELAMQREANMVRTQRIAATQSGSPTARVLQEIADMTADQGKEAGTILRAFRDPVGVGVDILGKLTGAQQTQLKQDVAEAVGHILLTAEPEQIAKLMAKLQGASNIAAQTGAAEAAVAKGAGVAAGETVNLQ